MNKVTKAICHLVIAIGFINFFAFMAQSQRLGGDALNGYQANGHFYVSEHGRTTEVPESVWRQNRLQAISLFFTHPLTMAAMFYLLIHDSFPKMIFRGQSKDRERKEKEVRASSSALTSFSCGGKIGSLSCRSLKVTIYAGGIHCKLTFMPPFAILRSDIQSVSVQNSWLRKGVEIVHASAEVASPIFLNCSRNQDAVSALTSLLA